MVRTRDTGGGGGMEIQATKYTSRSNAPSSEESCLFLTSHGFLCILHYIMFHFIAGYCKANTTLFASLIGKTLIFLRKLHCRNKMAKNGEYAFPFTSGIIQRGLKVHI